MCCQIQSLWSNIHRLSREIASIETGSGSTQINIGTVETVDIPYLTITGNPESGYILNIGFPQSSSSTDNYKGEYNTSAEIIANNPNSVLGDYAYNNETSSFWYYSPTLGTYLNQEVTVAQYNLYSDEVKSEISFIIIPG